MATKRARKSYSGRIHGGSFNIGNDAADYFDAITGYLAADFPKIVQGAVYSTAYFTQKEMKAQFKAYAKGSGSPSRLQRDRLIDKESSSAASGRKGFYGADFGGGKGLGRAFEYRKLTGAAAVGWLSSSAAASAKRWQTGGVKSVGSSGEDDESWYEKAARKNPTKWAYVAGKSSGGKSSGGGSLEKRGLKVITVGKHSLIVPRAGKRIEHKTGGKKTNFMPLFVARNKVAIVNTLRRKIEEKLEIVGRGSYEKQIKIDFVRVRRRASVAIHNYSVGAINAIIAQQHNILARFG